MSNLRTALVSALLCVLLVRLVYLEVTAGSFSSFRQLRQQREQQQQNEQAEIFESNTNSQSSPLPDALAPQSNTSIISVHRVPTVYLITPTYERLTQKADLTRMMHTLIVSSQTASLFWILVEDAPTPSKMVTRLLARSGLSYVHLYKKSRKDAHLKAAETRNEGVMYLRSLSPRPHPDSVVYFADDDNVYDDRLFKEILSVRTIGVWPVGFSGQRRAEFPYIINGKVTGFNSYLGYLRRFPMDMASFGINIKYFMREVPLLFDPEAPPVFGETMLLESTRESWDALEPKAANCTLVLVWHTKVERPIIKPGFDTGKHIEEV